MSSKGLGRGLDALLRRTDMGAARQEKSDSPEKETGTEHSPTLLPLSHLHANPSQPRQTFDAESLAELAASIREQGIIQPLLVRPLADRPGHYQIVAGERRWRAARQAGLGQVPVHVREMSDAEVMAAAEVLRSHIISESLSVRQAEEAVALWREEQRLPWTAASEAAPQRPAPCKRKKLPQIAALQKSLCAALPCKARVSGDMESGRITLRYTSPQELEALLNRLHCHIPEDEPAGEAIAAPVDAKTPRQ